MRIELYTCNEIVIYNGVACMSQKEDKKKYL